ncbi:MAG TPA: hypothetical protein VFO16_13445 [Pseudonocardiaceae bacterium]|nr:hypothetical protein [Pseudonocardiaceae bacterium]
MSAPEIPLNDDLRGLLSRALMARELDDHPELMLMPDTWENGLARAEAEADKLIAHMRLSMRYQRRQADAS